MEFILPRKIQSIISLLNNAGYKAHIVGGCVRDLSLGKTPHDWDITTSALPAQVKSVFQTCHDTGLKHGTVTISYQGEHFEITTWRRETGYQDHRRPDKVAFTASLQEDLSRRDFTMNAMAYHPEEGLIDPFGGLDDIRCQIIRSVGDPELRFTEDALRMIRAIRFSAQLGFSIEATTLNAIKRHSRDIAYVSMERIQSELQKILNSESPDKLKLLWDTGLQEGIIPEIDSLPVLWLDAAKRLKSPDNAVLLLSMLFYTAFTPDGKKQAEAVLRRLKYDYHTIRRVGLCLFAMSDTRIPSARNLRSSFYSHGHMSTEMACLAHDLLRTPGGTDRGSAYKDAVASISPVGDAQHGLALSGQDLEILGFKGREIGLILAVLILCVCERPELNTSETLLMIVGALRELRFS
mgnify:CR=1 FL=1